MEEQQVVLYTIKCPKCIVLEKKLQSKNIAFEVVDDRDAVVNYGKEHGINGAPILEVNGKPMDFNAANNWVNGR